MGLSSAITTSSWLRARRLLSAWDPAEALDLLQPPRCQLCGSAAAADAAWTCEAHDPRARSEVSQARAGAHHDPAGASRARAEASSRARAEAIACAWCDRRLGLPGREAGIESGGSSALLAGPSGSPGEVLCPACEQADAEGRSRPGRCIALGTWRDGPLAGWVLALKHAGRPDLVEPLGSLLAARVLQRLSLDERAAGGVLVPLPLHPVRRVERGYDQAALLAHVLARMLGWRVARWLLRRRATPPQGSWWGPPRHANLRGALAVAPWAPGPISGPTCGRPAKSARGRTQALSCRPDPPRALGRRLVPRALARQRGAQPPVWLVDDVTTSGSTLAEACGLLTSRGLEVAGALVLARAGDPESLGAPSRGSPSRWLASPRFVGTCSA